MELSRIILIVLKDERGKLRLSDFFTQIVTDPAFKKLIMKPSNTEILHTIDVLVYDQYIIRSERDGMAEYQLSSKGYAKLKAWYAPQKLLNLISTDVVKILTIIATMLSIIATYLSIKAKL
jgi:hypothetical protein